MAFFENLGSEIGTGIGKGINYTVATTVKVAAGATIIFCKWFFAWEKPKETESFMQLNSLRIFVAVVITGCFTIPGLIVIPSWKPSIQTTLVEPTLELLGQLSPLQSQRKVVAPLGPKVLQNLVTHGTVPFPDTSLFVPTTDQTKMFADKVGDITYIRYQNRMDGMPSQIILTGLEGNVCVIVPTTKEVLIKTLASPTTVYNMDAKVTYVAKEELATRWERALKSTVREDGWQYLSINWNEVDTSKMLRAKAHEPVKATPSTSLGGLVCFS